MNRLARRQASYEGRSFKTLSIGRTDVGCARALNEDAFLDRPDLGIWAVADGMGGHNGGEIASARVVEALSMLPSTGDITATRERVTHVLGEVNASLVRDRPLEDGPTGSTVAALLIRDGRYNCLWAGDSRIYLYRRGRLQLLTRDHSHVQELVDAGLLRADEAHKHPKRNVITRAVGAQSTLLLDMEEGEVCDDDRFLLCSDGLSSLLHANEIADELRRAPAGLAAERLISRALSRQAPDNVTVVIVIVRQE